MNATFHWFGFALAVARRRAIEWNACRKGFFVRAELRNLDCKNEEVPRMRIGFGLRPPGSGVLSDARSFVRAEARGSEHKNGDFFRVAKVWRSESRLGQNPSRRPRSAPSWMTVAIAIALLAAFTAPAVARVEVTVTRVGFPEVGEGDIVRVGAWAPIHVDVDLIDQASFDGLVRAAQFDTDGDRAFDEVPIHLRSESGGRRIVLYLVPNPERGDPSFWVELLDEEGEAVEVVSQGQLTFRAEPAQQPRLVGADDLVILSVSHGTAGHVQELAEANRKDAYRRPVHIAHVGASELPDLWKGLEGVDGVVWDDARPEELTDRQLAALLDWTRFGGRLLMAGSRTSGSLKIDEATRAALPADLGGVDVVANLPRAREKLLGPPTEESDIPTTAATTKDPNWFMEPFPAPIEVVSLTPRGNSRILVLEESTARPLLVEGRLGQGSVVYFAAALRDFFSGKGLTPPFFEYVFDIEKLRGEPSVFQYRSLFDHVVSAIAFARSASAYLLAAFLFSGAYLAAATGGVWWFLGRRGWRHHSWTGFALLAIVASGLSVLAVKQVHGFGDALHQVSVIDLDAGERVGVTTTYFGLKSGSDKTVDVWMPADPLSATDPQATTSFLRPLPASGRALELGSTFADPQGYALRPGSAAVEDVRIRSTLKRFEGRSEISVGGTVTGSITIRGKRVDGDASIRNDLGVTLTDCYVLQSERGLRDISGARSDGIYAYFIGDVPGDGSTVPLGPRLEPPRPRGANPNQPIRRPTLRDRHKEWSSPFQSLLGSGFGFDQSPTLVLGQERAALLLASTIGDLEPDSSSTMAGQLTGPWTWSRDRLRHLDLSAQLEPDCVVLIGFASDPGPARLFRRTGERPFRAMEPDRAWTMYRVRIPVNRLPASPLDADESMLGESDE